MEHGNVFAYFSFYFFSFILSVGYRMEACRPTSEQRAAHPCDGCLRAYLVVCTLVVCFMRTLSENQD